MMKRYFISWLILAGLTVLAFQNCGKGFSADAENSSSSQNETAYWDGSPLEGVIRNAKILLVDPFVASGNSELPFDADFSMHTESVDIGNLLDEDHLSNGKVSLSSDTLYPDQIAKPSDDLNFDITDPRFQQVNAYFHIDRLTSGLMKQNLYPSNLSIVKVDAHSKHRNNAYYVPYDNSISLGYVKFSGYNVWASNDADSILHEFGHALNNGIATPEIFSKHVDMAALDEGFADVWAYLQNGQATVSHYFFSAMAAGGLNLGGGRSLAENYIYPDFLQGEIHEDGRIIGSVFHHILQSDVDRLKARELLVRTLENLQSDDSMEDVIRSLREESDQMGIMPSAKMNAILAQRGLLRKDSLEDVVVDPSKPVYIVDNHVSPILVGGNCNRALDAGETAMLIVNLKNNGSQSLGTVIGSISLDASEDEIFVLPETNSISYFRLDAGKDFRTIGRATLARDETFSYASVVVKAKAGAAGKTFSGKIKISGFNSIDDQKVTTELPFTLTVGSVATRATNCTSGAEYAAWP